MTVGFSPQARIDIHCHAVPPKYRKYALENGHDKPDGMPALPLWSPEQHITVMDKLNIRKSILSVSSPGTFLTPKDPHQAARITRQTNEELSTICARYPTRFGFFASLPLPSTDDSISEIDYALDILGAVGFIILSNAGGVYPGDRVLDPVFTHLNARRAILFIHPTTCQVFPATPAADGQMEAQPVKPLDQLPRPMMEFMFDETRAIANLLLSGTVAQNPKIAFIMSHCACALPSLIDRVGGFASLISTDAINQSDEFRKLLRENFHFDLAGFPFPNQIHGLLKALGVDGEKNLVYGTDYPFTPEKVVLSQAEVMKEGCEGLFSVDQRKNIYMSNAEKLLDSHKSTRI